ncbi:PaaI family thioesterase [Paraglaciecola sp. 20A4]|uniref:PaaI family thioesterase n=1 Tax=Paraglaciecola sp. 20A4 TaxID=2687288 RepID=UPI0014073B90|nr:PaaI family thioesterase [Paraglaciecola sp. 20A4]
MTSKEQAIEKINHHAPMFIGLLGGKLVDFDAEKDACRFEFNIGTDYCHSIDVVQGGFVTAMLDTVMSHAVMALNRDITNISSLEIKTTYLEPTRAGKLRVEGWAVKKGYKVAFMEGRIYNENNVLTATASSVAKLSRAPK